MSKQMCSRRAVIVLLSAVGSIGLARDYVFATATNYYWSGPVGSWSDKSNWNGVLPVSSADTFLNFAPTGTTSYTAINDLTAPFTLSALYANNKSSSTTTISGSSLQFVDSPQFKDSGFISQLGTGVTVVANGIVLPGQIRVIADTSGGTLTLSGQISGVGSLTAQTPGGFDPRHIQITVANTFTGGTFLQGGGVWVRGDGNLSVGSVSIGSDHLDTFNAGQGIFDSDANVAGGDGSVHVRSGGIVQFNNMSAASLAKISRDSTGVLAVPAAVDPAIVPSSIDLTNLPGLRLGSDLPTGVTSTSISTNIIPSNNTYKFGGAAHYTGDTLRVVSILPDRGGPTSLDFGSSRFGRGGRLVISNTSNSYTGGTVIEPQTYYGETNLVFDYTPTTGQTPLGTGPVTVAGQLTFEGAAGAVGALPNAINFQPGSSILFNNIVVNGSSSTVLSADRWGDSKPLNLNGTIATLQGASTTEKVGSTTYSDGSSLVISSYNSASVFELSTLARSNRGTLVLTSTNNLFGKGENVIVDTTNGLVDPTTGMVSPSIIGESGTSSTFLLVGTNNILQPLPDHAFDPNSDHEIVSPTNYVSVDDTCWAASLGYTTIAPGKTVTIRSGGLIVSGSIAGGGIRFDNYGTPTEALIYTDPYNYGTISSNITANAGLTKFGSGDLTLPVANSITGGVQVQGGRLIVADSNALGTPGTNAMYLNPRSMLILNGITLNVASLSGSGSLSSGGVSTIITGTPTDSTFGGNLAGVGSNSLSFTKTGPATLTLSSLFSSFSGTLTVQAGTLNFNGYNRSQSNYTITSGATLSFNAGNDVNRLDGLGVARVASLNSYSTTTVTANTVRAGALILEGNNILSLRPSNGVNDSSDVGQLQIAGGTVAPTAMLDVSDNDLIVGSQTPKTDIDKWVGYSRDGGLWDRGGIATSLARPIAGAQKPTGLGVLSAAEYGSVSTQNLTFSGQSFSSTDTLVKYTWNGDADFNGKVNANDYGQIDSGYQNQRTAGFVFDWFNGDFDYSGKIDANDYALIDSAYQLQSGTLRDAIDYLETGAVPGGTISESLQEVIDHENQFGASYANDFIFANVPEPTSFVAGALAISQLLFSRRRRSTR